MNNRDDIKELKNWDSIQEQKNRWDEYLYQDTGVLKNKLNINDMDKLTRIENELVLYKSQILDNYINLYYEDEFNEERLKAIHSFLFSDLYDWAGEYRNINVKKPEKILNNRSVQYAKCYEIEDRLKTIMKQYNSQTWLNNEISKKEKLMGWGHLLCELWQTHMFREGNTRACVAFSMQFADKIGLKLNKEYFRDHSSSFRDSMILYADGKSESFQAFLYNAYIDEEKQSIKDISMEFMKSFSIADFDKTIDKWMDEDIENEQLKNYMKVNKKSLMSSLLQGRYADIHEVKTAFDYLVSSIGKELEFDEVKQDEQELE